MKSVLLFAIVAVAVSHVASAPAIPQPAAFFITAPGTPFTYTSTYHVAPNPLIQAAAAGAPTPVVKSAAVPSAPLPIVAPAAVPVPVTSPLLNAPVISQFHAQDELGRYSYGYSGSSSAKFESKDIQGVVKGTFSYVDPVGDVQTQNYVADKGGFRTAGTNIPVAPKVA